METEETRETCDGIIFAFERVGIVVLPVIFGVVCTFRAAMVLAGDLAIVLFEFPTVCRFAALTALLALAVVFVRPLASRGVLKPNNDLMNDSLALLNAWRTVRSPLNRRALRAFDDFECEPVILTCRSEFCATFGDVWAASEEALFEIVEVVEVRLGVLWFNEFDRASPPGGGAPSSSRDDDVSENGETEDGPLGR